MPSAAAAHLCDEQAPYGARVVARVLLRLLKPKLPPQAEAAARYEGRLRAFFLSSVNAAREQVPTKDLEDVLRLGHGGTGAVEYLLEDVLKSLERTLLGAHVQAAPADWLRLRAAADKTDLPSLLHSTLAAGADAGEVCVLPNEAAQAGTKTKAKAQKATQAQIDTIWQLKQSGKSYAEIAKETGLTEKYASHIVFHVKHGKIEITKLITPPAPTAPISTLHPSKVAKWDASHPSGKPFEQFWYEKKQYHGFTDAEILENLKLQGHKTDPGQLLAHILTKGKEQAQSFEAAKIGSAYKPPMQDVYKSSRLTGPVARGESWPIADDVVRTGGSQYPLQVDTAFRDWVSSLSYEQRAALRSYTGSSTAINNYLRRGIDAQGYKGKAADIAKALNKTPSPPPPDLVWRGVRGEYTLSFKNLASGDVIEMNGFQSTSIKPDFAHRWSRELLLEIKPTRGGYVESFTALSGEHEFILPHGAKYRVVGRKVIKLYDEASAQIVSRSIIQLEML